MTLVGKKSKDTAELEQDFTVDLALIKHGITRIRIKEPLCVIQRTDKKPDIIFEINEQQIVTILNFQKVAEETKLSKGLTDSIGKYFIEKYFKIKEANAAVRYKVRLVLPDQEIKCSWPRTPDGYYPDVSVTQCARMHEDKVRVVGG